MTLDPTAPLRILLVEDNPADAEILIEVVNADCAGQLAIEWVDRAGKGAERLGREPRVDVALVDLKLPDADGLEALDRLLGVAPATPVFVMTGLEDEDLAADAKRRGAAGYLVKGRVDGARLRALLVAATATSDGLPGRAAL